MFRTMGGVGIVIQTLRKSTGRFLGAISMMMLVALLMFRGGHKNYKGRMYEHRRL